MYGWCDKCGAIAIEGLCSIHGKTKPLDTINSNEINPLPESQKKYINEHLNGELILGKGVFLVYKDRIYRRRVVFLDKPLLEIKYRKDGMHITPFLTGTFEGMDIQDICDVNYDRIERMAKISKLFAQSEIENNGKSIISFSGGKDSAVLAHLLDDFSLKNVFVDTTIEFPETYSYIKEFKHKGGDIDITRAKYSFFKLCNEKGFPSYKNRWCCKTQKFEPFSNYLDENFDDGKILVFSGIRRWESINRMEQPIKKLHKHIKNQETCQILLDWLSIDAWAYTWMNNIPISDLYNYYERGGCWICPFGMRYRIRLMEEFHPTYFKVYQNMSENGKIENDKQNNIPRERENKQQLAATMNFC